MRLAALLLIVVGGVSPLVSVTWAYLLGRRRLAVLDRTEQVRDEAKSRQADVNDALRAAGIPATIWNDIEVVRALIERSIVRESSRSLVGPALLGFVGVAAGTAGGALALYLPV